MTFLVLTVRIQLFLDLNPMANDRNKRLALLALKVLIFAGLSLLLYKQVVGHEKFEKVAGVFRDGLTGNKTLVIAGLVLTMLLNWGLETAKWRSLVLKLQFIGWFTALKGVLFGIALSLFTPNRVGEFGGRVLALPDKRGPAVVVTLLGSLAQIVANLSLGGLGLFIYFFAFGDIGYLQYVFLFVWILLTAGLFLVYFNLDVVEGALLKIPLLKKVKVHIDMIRTYSRRELMNYLLLSAGRCLTYYFQFWLCLKFFGIHLPLGLAMALIASIFFVQTVIPTFAIIELVVRGNVALSFLTSLTENSAGVLSATFLLWIVNLIIPAFAGLLLFLRHRILKGHTGHGQPAGRL
jgi:uncharacterized membrane protein YbhN (UPF0104 family)